MGASVPRILLATARGRGHTFLDEADHLASYDGIVFEPLWFSFHGQMTDYQAAPGGVAYASTVGDVPHRRRLMSQRSRELTAFLNRGGILLVLVREPVWLVNRPDEAVSTYEWILTALGLHIGSVALPAKGSDVRIVDQHHPLAARIAASTYDARIVEEFLEIDGAHVLATNRAGDLIGVEVPVGRGFVWLVPFTSEIDLVVDDLREVLAERPPSEGPIVTEEAELNARAARIRAQMEAQLIEVRRELADVDARKRVVLERDHVKRAEAHLRAALSATNDRTSFEELYSLVEIVDARVGGSRKDVARALGVQFNVIDDIARDSNQPGHGLRHTTDQPLTALPPGRLAAARMHGQELFAAFLDWELKQPT